MKRLIFVCFALLLSISIAVAQDLPFDAFRKAVREESGGFAGNKEKLSKVFNAERIRLGQNFETELWKYLGDDADKHFWISSFITAKSYLHGNVPLPELAFRIRTRALELLEHQNDKRSLGRKVTINRHLAVSSKLAGKQEEATGFRDSAEALLAKHDNLSAYISGRTLFDVCIYKNIAGSIAGCKQSETPKERVITAGWMNLRALNFVKPEYPPTIKDPKKSERVDVKITTDVDGNVISAEILRGPIELHNAALDAARNLKFPPTQLSGIPTKVSGWVSFDFKP